jgi:DNA mismatch endonuclease (patch repair protein)
MSANRGKNTRPELVLRSVLCAEGARGYRLHPKDVPGRPDIAFRRHRLAVFVNGCFWHRCPKCNLPLPKTHREFWKRKFERNRNRDVAKNMMLKAAGWRVITVWEHEIRKNPRVSARRIKRALESSSAPSDLSL